MKIAVDGMGGDYGPEVTVKGCIEAAETLGVQIILVGKEKTIKKYIDSYGYNGTDIVVCNAEQVIEGTDEPVMSIKKKTDSSMVKGFRLLKNGDADAFISAGNTGALMAGALLMLGRVKGIKRPALAPLIPTIKGRSMLLDVGANTDCLPENIEQFALMGTVYMNKVLDTVLPSVGLINIGIEENKGNAFTKKTYALLKKSSINFKGNVEARDILYTDVDVIVCDGFVGNIVLKLIEGTASAVFGVLKKEFTKNFVTKLAALILKPGLKSFKDSMDYTEYGGAPLLGVNGAVIKAHGSSDAKAVTNAVRQAKKFIENDVLGHIKEQILDLGEK